jgi:hypothetical protein
MKKTLLIALSIILCIAEAQIPFSNVNQAPLLMSPSLAGAKKGLRISTNANGIWNSNIRHSNAYASVDILSKKLRSGLGFYYLFTNGKTNRINVELKNDLGTLLPQKFESAIKNQTLGVCIAPKFISEDGNRTFSPSVFFEYGNGNQFYKLNDEYSYTYQYSPNQPNGVATKDSLTYYTSTVKQQTFNTGLGFSYLTDKLMIATKSSCSMYDTEEQLTHHEFSFATKNQAVNTKKVNKHLFGLSNSAHLAYSFTQGKDADFSLTPIVGIGMNHYLNLPQIPVSTDANETVIYPQSIIRKSYKTVNYYHTALNLRFVNFLTGLSYTKSQTYEFYGLNIGYQNSHFKLLTNWMIRENTPFGEIALSYWWN